MPLSQQELFDATRSGSWHWLVYRRTNKWPIGAQTLEGARRSQGRADARSLNVTPRVCNAGTAFTSPQSVAAALLAAWG